MFTPEEREEFHGLYWEEVGKIVDSLEEGILNREYDNQYQVEARLVEIVARSDWVTARDHWAIHTLLFSRHPSAALAYCDPPELPVDAVFPFGYYAELALRADCGEKLAVLAAYQALPPGEKPDSDQARLIRLAEQKKVTAAELWEATGGDPDALNNGGLAEVIDLLLADDEPEWIETMIHTLGTDDGQEESGQSGQENS